MDAYTEDLAYIHDAGFGGFARGAAPGVLAALRRAGIGGGLVVDLGAGSGIWAEILLGEGYDVLGLDLSPAMLALARRRTPAARFEEGSLLRVPLPPCAAVTALGECVNYLFDIGGVGGIGGGETTAAEPPLPGLFARVHEALRPGGLFVFDVAEPGQVPPGKPRRGWTEGPDWAIGVHVEEDPEARLLTRRMTFFRQVGDLYRRGEEVHQQRLYPRAEVKAALRQAGFRVTMARAYGDAPLAPAHTAFFARKAGKARKAGVA